MDNIETRQKNLLPVAKSKISVKSYTFHIFTWGFFIQPFFSLLKDESKSTPFFFIEGIQPDRKHSGLNMNVITNANLFSVKHFEYIRSDFGCARALISILANT